MPKPDNLDPYFVYAVTPKQASALVRLRESRSNEGDEPLVIEALLRICNPYPNTHTKEPFDTAFLNGRREVMNIFNSICDEHILTKRTAEDGSNQKDE